MPQKWEQATSIKIDINLLHIFINILSLNRDNKASNMSNIYKNKAAEFPIYLR